MWWIFFHFFFEIWRFFSEKYAYCDRTFSLIIIIFSHFGKISHHKKLWWNVEESGVFFVLGGAGEGGIFLAAWIAT
jgi:hypothetical protein